MSSTSAPAAATAPPTCFQNERSARRRGRRPPRNSIAPRHVSHIGGALFNSIDDPRLDLDIEQVLSLGAESRTHAPELDGGSVACVRNSATPTKAFSLSPQPPHPFSTERD
jgi:hypothetical protein